MNWISVKKYLPSIESRWVITRSINSDKEIFYIMGIYIHRNQEWDLWSDDAGLTITHWCYPDEVSDEI